jgi:plasmid segregation protein ParM
MKPNVLAIDVGYGHTKAVHRPTPGVIRPISFPSFALPTAAEGLQDNCITSGAKVMSVAAGASRYLVGEEIEYLTRPTDERSREEAYSVSDPYLALVRGAMSRAGYSTIDLLIVGLPLTTLESNAERLRERLVGTHEVPPFIDIIDQQECSEVLVKRVEVLAQPLGALVSALSKEENKGLKLARVLTLDMGHNTLDGITSHGLRPLPKRSGAVQGGVAAYIDKIQESVEEEVRQRIPQLNGQYRVPTHIYEEALRNPAPRKVHLSVGPIDVEKHIGSAEARLTNDVAKVLATVGSIADISTVVLAGGGASLLAPVLRRNYPTMVNIIVAENPQFAIANGYLLFGEMLLHQEAMRGR